jgi:hypothetical protein
LSLSVDDETYGMCAITACSCDLDSASTGNLYCRLPYPFFTDFFSIFDQIYNFHILTIEYGLEEMTRFFIAVMRN